MEVIEKKNKGSFPDILRKMFRKEFLSVQNTNQENTKTSDNEIMTTSLEESMRYLSARLKPDMSFDVVYRVINVGGRQACIYFIDGFCKDELMMKILQYFIDLKPENMPDSAYEMAKRATPYVEVDLKDKWSDIFYNILSGVFALFIDGYDRCVLIDSRTYPARSVSEPERIRRRAVQRRFCGNGRFQYGVDTTQDTEYGASHGNDECGQKLPDRYRSLLHGQSGGP